MNRPPGTGKVIYLTRANNILRLIVSSVIYRCRAPSGSAAAC